MSLKKQGKYRFYEFEVDLPQRTLRRDGHTVAVSSRTFELLVYFVEHPQRLVTQAALMASLWPNSSVEESNLGQHIFLLRRALSGEQSGDKLVLTFPGKGYQFTAGVTEVAPEVSPEAAEASELVEAGSAGRRGLALGSGRRRSRVSFELPEIADGDRHSQRGMADSELQPGFDADGPDAELDDEQPKPRLSRPLMVAMLVLVLAGLAVGGWLLWRWHHRQRQDSLGLVIADFYNSTGNPLFDESIRKAVSVDLQQSPFLRVASEDEVRKTLAQVRSGDGKAGGSSLTSEVCRRLGDQAYLAGEIHPFSRKWMVAIQIFDCASGKSLAESRGIAESPDAVLPILDRVALDLRKQLGEPSESLEHFRKPLFSGHTGSLEAFKAYADASELQLEGKLADASRLLQRAVELDPQFVNAYAELGVVEFKLGDREIGQSTLSKAYGQRQMVTEYSRIFITAAYNDLVTGDLEASIRNEKEGMALYPRNSVFASNLASFEILVGKPAAALEPARRSIALNADNAAAYLGLARAEMQLGQFEEGEQTCRKAIARHLDGVDIHGILLQIAYLRLDQPAMEEQMAWARGIEDPDAEAYMQLQQGLIAFAEGKTKAALSIFTSLIEGYRKRGETEVASSIQSRVPRMEAELGLVEGAHALLNRLPEDTLAGSVDIPVAWAEVGETSRAEALLGRSVEAHPAGTLWLNDKGPQIRSAIALNQQKAQDAVEALQVALPFDLRGFDVPALRGRAYLAAKQPALAETEFRKILDHHGVEPLSYNYELAYLGVARALAQQEKTTDARAAYGVLLSIWKDADADLPRLKAAKEEYARLGGVLVKARAAAVSHPAVSHPAAKPASAGKPSASKPSASKPSTSSGGKTPTGKAAAGKLSLPN